MPNEEYKKCEAIIIQLKSHQNAKNYFESSNNNKGLKAIEDKLKNNEYSNYTQFTDEIKMIWSTAIKNSQPGTLQYSEATELKVYFENLIKNKEELKKETIFGSNTEQPMTTLEKAQLKEKITKMHPEKLLGLLDLLKGHINVPENSEIVEFDIDTLPSSVCRELDKYVSQDSLNTDQIPTPCFRTIAVITIN